MANSDDPPTVAEWLAGGADIPEVGRGGGRVLSGTTGELAAVLGHVTGCQECRERWPAAEGMLVLELLPSGHVGYTVEMDGDPERLEVRAGRESERASGASLEGGKEAPQASRPTLLEAVNRLALMVGVRQAAVTDDYMPHLIDVMTVAADELAELHGRFEE